MFLFFRSREIAMSFHGPLILPAGKSLMTQPHTASLHGAYRAFSDKTFFVGDQIADGPPVKTSQTTPPRKNNLRLRRRPSTFLSPSSSVLGFLSLVFTPSLSRGCVSPRWKAGLVCSLFC